MCMKQKELFVSMVQAELRNEFDSIKNDEIIVYGAGRNGVVLVNELNAIGYGEIRCFVDSSDAKIGSRVCGLDVISPDSAIKMYPNATWVIGSTDYAEDIRVEILKRFGSVKVFSMPESIKGLFEQLALFRRKAPDDTVAYVAHWFDVYNQMEKEGVLQRYIDEIKMILEDSESKQVIDARFDFFKTGNIDCLKKVPYSAKDFHSSYMHLSDDEVYFDVGAYTGDTASDFIRLVDGRFKKIFAFEPDSENYRKMMERIGSEQVGDIVSVKKAVGKTNEKMYFSEEGHGNSKLSESGSVEVDVTCIDSYYDEKPTFIHMDIEGAEMDALEGGVRTITDYKPKLSISIYHKPLDFYLIPKFIKRINPDYKFYIRHHHKNVMYDMILYAR